MKLGILTFHNSINNGAVIQCFSLWKRLAEEFPNDIIEVVDYQMPKVEVQYTVSIRSVFGAGSISSILKKLVYLVLSPMSLHHQRQRYKAFKSVRGNLPLSKTKIISNGTTELFDYLNKNYDIVVVGSDAIWNYSLRGFPNPYFLSVDVHAKKFFYAASCYGMSYENIPNTEKAYIKECIDDFVFTGVRDDESIGFLNTIGCETQCSHTCDPTVFLDIESLPVNYDEIRNKLIRRGFDFARESIAIMGTPKMYKMVRKMFGNSYQIVSLYNFIPGADVNLHDFTPYEWAYVFRFFKLTITTYFHGTLVSLRNGVPVVCIALNTEYSKVHMTKVEDFLRRIGYQDCYFHTDYESLNCSEIKIKAQQLINAQMKEQILNKMDKESISSKVFINQLKKYHESL